MESSASVITEKQNEPLVCDHCGALLKNDQHKDDNELRFCCAGCRMVYGALHESGMESYYQYREKDYVPGSFQPDFQERDYSYLDGEDFRERYLICNGGSVYTAKLYIKGIHCSACIWVVERITHLHEGIQSVRLQYSASTVSITFDVQEISLSEIAELLSSFGYEVSPAEQGQSLPSTDKSELSRLGVSALCAAHTMIIAVSLYEGSSSGIELKYRNLLHLVSFLLTIPVITYCSVPFYRSALAGILVRRPHVDLPISVGIVLSFLLSAYNALGHAEYVYFESVCALVFFLLAGRFLQKKIFERSRRECDLQGAFFPFYAYKINEDGEEAVLVQSLRRGDLVRVPAGSRVPIDGIIKTGESAVDQSVLNGEATPLPVSAGDTIYAGTLNTEGELRICVEAEYQQSRAYKLMEILREGEEGEPETYADRLSFYFVAGVLLLALLAFLFWIPAGLTPALEVTVALLVVSCPCAFALASPLAYAVAIGRGARKGIFIKRPSALLSLLRCKVAIFDKTGTLTYGKLQVKKFNYLSHSVPRERALSVLLALEAVTPEHPVARAVLDSELLREIVPAADLTSIRHLAGKGVAGLDAKSEQWQLLRACGERFTEGVVLSKGEDVVLHITLSDKIRPAASSFLQMLQGSGISTCIASGDAVATVREVGAELGIPEEKLYGALLPEEKRSLVQSFDGGVVFTGDGVNDAAALAAADVSIGVKSPAEASLENADIFISREIVPALYDIWHAAKKLHRTIVWNMIFSVTYNVIGVSLAMAGYMTPLLAAILMPLSSITVIGSSSLLRVFR